MSAGRALQEALVAAVAATGLRAFDAPPVRAAVPHAVVELPLLRSWNAAGTEGREGRVTVLLHDEGERPERLWRLLAGVEGAMVATPPELAGGWRLVAGQVGATRIRRADGAMRWTAAVEMRVRMYRVQ